MEAGLQQRLDALIDKPGKVDVEIVRKVRLRLLQLSTT